LRIACCDRYPLLIEECRRTMEEVRNGRRLPGLVPAVGCVQVSSYWKHWPCLFPQHGPGRKHLRSIHLSAWQQRIAAEYPALLMRGLIHSDGWRGANTVNGKNYPRYQFTNYSADIRDIFCRACNAFGIRWRRMNQNTVSIAKAIDVAKLDGVIGPKR
jgi:hypothetical protein